MDLSILIVSYNTRDLTLACLASLRGESLDLEIAVLDNASQDGSADAIAEAFPDVRLVRSEQNLGFAAGVNRLARDARAEWLLLLNPDARACPGSLERLLEFGRSFEEREVICGGRTLNEDGSLNPTSCWAHDSLWSLSCAASGLSSVFRRNALFDPISMGGWARDSVRRVDIVTGCVFLVRRSTWNELGGFDERFFMYSEEADLCLRARARGIECWFTPDAEFVHIGGASERVNADRLVRLLGSRIRLLRKHWSPLRAGLGVALLKAWPLTRSVAWSLVAPFRGARARVRAQEWGEVRRRLSGL